MIRRAVFALVVLLALPLAADDDLRLTFTHFAGADGGNGSTDGRGASARFFSPAGISTDAGKTYVASTANTIRKITRDEFGRFVLAGPPLRRHGISP